MHYLPRLRKDCVTRAKILDIKLVAWGPATVSYIYIAVPSSTVSSVNQYYALHSVQCTVKIEHVKTIHCATGQFLCTSDYLA